jgi:CBS domain containing-hemolysin-like protein
MIICSAFFSATETAFSTLSRIRLKSLSQNGNKKAQSALDLSDRYSELLICILVGNNIVNIIAATLSTLLFVSIWPDTGATISTAVITVAVLIFGEITPKSLAKENSENYAMATSGFLKFLMTIFKPLNSVLLKFESSMGKLFGVKKRPGITEDELLTLVDEAKEKGGIDAHEGELLKNAIEFNDLDAKDIMTPRTEVEAIDISTENSEIAGIFRTTGFSRIPVYEENIDSILGVINEKDFHNYIYGTNKNIRAIMKPAVFIPPTVKISELMKTLQRSKLHMAVIIDEFGGTEGIVTLEDIIEELVGEIWDEHDEIKSSVKKLEDGSYLILADADLDDIFEKLQINDVTEASTVNGWLSEKLDKIPEKGDKFTFGNYEIEVIDSKNQRATEISVKKNEDPSTDGTESDVSDS